MRALGILTLVAAALAVATAPATAAIQIGEGRTPDVAVAADGTAHVVWTHVTRDGSEARWKTGYCRLPSGADRCDVEVGLPGPGAADFASPPHVFLYGSRVIIVGGGLADDAQTLLWESTDGGSSFSQATIVGTVRPDAAVLTRDGNRVVVMARGNAGQAIDLQSVPADGSSAAITRAQIAISDPADWLTIGLSGAAPVAVWDDLYTRHLGGDANATSSWAGPMLTSGGAFAAPTLAGGVAGLFLAEMAPEGVLVRAFDGQAFGPAVNATPADGGHGPQANPIATLDLAQDPRGRLHLGYVKRDDGSDGEVRYVASTDGQTFTAPVTIDSSTSLDDLRVASSGAGGLAVWWDYLAEPDEIEAARLPAPPPSPPPPPAPQPEPASQATPAPSAPVTPGATPRPPQLDRLRLTRRTFRAKGRRPRLRFTLDRAATVTLTVRRIGSRRPAARIARISGRAGGNAVVLSRRLLRGAPGRFRLTAVPAADGLSGPARALTYRVRR